MPSVLIVDDEVDLAEMLGLSLAASGWTVHYAHDGNVALEQVQAVAPQVILLDIVMPGKDGWEVAAAVRKNAATAAIPILFMTAKQSPDMERRCLRAGGSGFFLKPFVTDAVLQAMRRAIS